MFKKHLFAYGWCSRGAYTLSFFKIRVGILVRTVQPSDPSLGPFGHTD